MTARTTVLEPEPRAQRRSPSCLIIFSSLCASSNIAQHVMRLLRLATTRPTSHLRLVYQQFPRSCEHSSQRHSSAPPTAAFSRPCCYQLIPRRQGMTVVAADEGWTCGYVSHCSVRIAITTTGQRPNGPATLIVMRGTATRVPSIGAYIWVAEERILFWKSQMP